MIELRLEIEDLADTRFAVSAFNEAVLSLRVWLLPGYYALQLPWLHHARESLGGLDIAPLLALVGPNRAVPDFLTPRPDEPVAGFDAELDRVRRVPPAKVAADIAAVHEGRPVPAVLADGLRRPRGCATASPSSCTRTGPRPSNRTGRGCAASWRPTCSTGRSGSRAAAPGCCSPTCTRASPGATACSGSNSATRTASCGSRSPGAGCA
ncbi:hypothetical protein ACFQHO_03635 [Actinomadura yumaensis]|uniref:hypothetical protein n=1 Tax=Actinomadura yumaensis TaxID=111807 RepID=UPI003618AF93